MWKFSAFHESILPLTLQLFSKVILFILFYKNEDHNYIFSNITKNNVCGKYILRNIVGFYHRVGSTDNFLSPIFKVWSMLHHRLMVRVLSKECWSMFTRNFWHFLVVVRQKNCLCQFHFFFFWWSINLPKQNTNQPEPGIGDKKLSMELYAQ